MSSSSRTLLAFLTGCATGAILGVLYAPEKGEITRDRLTYRLSKYREQLEKLIADLIEGKNLPDSLAKAEGERVVSDAREKAEKLLEDVDRLMAQIKNQNG
ncbi:YtxH domain-containing protein [Arundinibacter roseus]|uniref:YtxH domain-containing protein n=1 Tax=Arundinibacter roseus TaxID=2070510 RepID=A0A4R4KE98_9BACT|nr:YtxH domain-containing protein [Arundinibacter roseus]TDB65112.1 YtxH domain-containing protein [Arundinibacter roseus]